MKKPIMKKLIISCLVILLSMIHSSVYASPASHQAFINEWQHDQEIEKQADAMWENSPVKQQLDIMDFQDKYTAEQLIQNIKQENQKILNFIDEFHPKSEAVQHVVLLKKAILSKFQDHLIHHIELSSQHLSHDA